MANVFGNPITLATLQGMAEFVGKEITAVDKARVALNMKNANMKDTNARTYVDNLKRQWGTGVSTRCLVYNATGHPMNITSYKDWYGHIGPAPYPIEILNGQWGAFLHVKQSMAASGSTGGLVYRGNYGKEGNDCDYMLAWSNPWLGSYDNSVWAETREVNNYNDEKWKFIYKKLEKGRNGYEDSWEGCLSTILIGGNTSPTLEATFTLEDASKDAANAKS